MAKTEELDIHVPKYLLDGSYFQLCQDTFTSSLQPLQRCSVKVDEYGFFLHWKSQEKEGQFLDCSQIREICRHGYQYKDQKAYAILESAVKQSPATDRTILLVCGPDVVNYSTFLLLAEDQETAERWIKGLRELVHYPSRRNHSMIMALRKHWLKLCLSANRNDKIPVKSITRPFSSGKNAKLPFQALKDLGFPNSKMDFIDVKDFTFEKFYDLYQNICQRTDISQVFDNLSGSAKCRYVEAGPLAQWLNDHQRDPRLNEILFPMYDRKRTQQLIETFEINSDYAKKGRLTLEGFTRYLMSSENSPIYKYHLSVFEEMDQPLCHYFINSSHNTYLNGRQFHGKSTVDMYRQVLLSGCRCIELDCWDGKGENPKEPIITHGKAMCTDVLFKDVIQAINETAFVTSDYPVILSFENHCSKPYQLKMAKYCEDIFGDALVSKPLNDWELEAGQPLPSPNLLKRKILIKNKRLKPDVEKMQLERYYKHEEILEEEEEESQEDSSSIEEAHPELTRVKSESDSCIDPQDVQIEQALVHKQITKTDSVKTNGSASKEVLKKNDSVSEMTSKSSQSKIKKIEQLTEEDEKELVRNYKYVETSSTNIHPVLSSLINYCQSVKFQGFEYAEEQDISWHMSSFSESVGVGLLKTSAIEFVNYNKRQLSRIYPRGNRIDSSNYMPQVFWNAGCQMVSLNFQTSDISMQLNQGKFEYNGTSGYLLKPEFMRRQDRMFDPFSESPVDGVIAAHCSVQVLSGLFLSDKQIGTYVEVDMYGLPTDTIRKEHKTKTVPSNGLNPVYNSEPFMFRKVILPSLALIRFAVHDENGKLLGQRVIPLASLQCGYRHISLRSASGQVLDPACLFCNIVLKSYVPDGLSDFVNALADPKKYLSIVDVRAKQMRDMGIDDYDLNENGKIQSGKSVKHTSSISDNNKEASPQVQTTNQAGNNFSTRSSETKDSKSSVRQQYLPSSNTQQQNPVKEMMERNPVTLEILTNDETYKNLIANQEREIHKMRYKASKERESIQKKQEEKLKQLLMRYENDSASMNSFCCFAPKLRRNASYKVTEDISTRINNLADGERQKVYELQRDQDVVLSNHARSSADSMSNMLKHHKQQLLDALKQALSLCHQKALSDLKLAQQKEMGGLTQHQTKSSMMSTKGISSDKSIKRAEKDRRIREVSSSNAKKFMEERHMMTSRHKQEMKKMQNDQEMELSSIIADITEYIEKKVNAKELELEKGDSSRQSKKINLVLSEKNGAK